MMHSIIQTCPEQTSIMAYLTMKRLLDIHPPHTIREVYAHAFGATEDDTEFVQKTAINSVLSVIEYCVSVTGVGRDVKLKF